jgi:GTPase
MFVDEVTISIRAGKGGDGVVAFRRAKYEPKGGPAGGRGGRGGDVYVISDSNISDLSHLYGKTHFNASNGRPGEGNKKTGASGDDLIIKVPVGVSVFLDDDERLIADLVEEGQEYLVAKGGRGGLGNTSFVNPRRQTPHIATSGEKGEQLKIRIELKLLADVGLVGFPNAGKSTLLGTVSNANPKIGEYPFTTLHPYLGVITMPDWRRYTIADIPGLIKGASVGKGLGLEFLRHIERCRVLLYLIDLSDDDPIDTLKTLWNEIKLYSEETYAKPAFIVGNKIDICDESKANGLKSFAKERKIPYLSISAKDRIHVDRLIKTLSEQIDKTPIPKTVVETQVRLIITSKRVRISHQDDVYIVEHEPLERIVSSTDLESADGRAFIQRQIHRLGIEKKLRGKGAVDGDTVMIGNMRFALD